jgi:transposase-like protein
MDEGMEARLVRSPDPLLRLLVERLGYEEGARIYLERLRWPEGPRCPRCESSSIMRLEARRKYNCAGCKYQFRVTAGTRMHDSHVPGWKWLVAVDLMMSSSPDRLPAQELNALLGGSYKTAWFLAHRIRDALATTSAERKGPTPDRRSDPRAKYRRGREAEAAWRARHEPQSARFRNTVRALVEAEPLSWKKLIEGEAG